MSRNLPRDAASIRKLAARSMFDLFSSISEGMMLVDRAGRVVWINDSYRKFLPALGFKGPEEFGGRPVEEVVPNTLMRRVIETGKPILIDLLTNKPGTFVVSRIPLRDESGEVIGAIGIVLFDHPETTLQPLIAKFARMQQDLDDARRELAAQRRTKYTFASFIGTSPAALDVRFKTHDPIMHGVEGYKLLSALGYADEAFICASHILYGINSHEAEQYGLPRNDFIPTSFEARLIPLVDFLVEHDRPVLLRERFEHLRHRNRNNNEFLSRLDKAEKKAESLMNQLNGEFNISIEALSVSFFQRR